MSGPAAASSFSFEATADGARTLVCLEGEIDAYTSPRLAQGFADLGDVAGRHVVIDLAGVGFVDSAGLSTLVANLQALREDGGAVSLRSVSRQLSKLFDITGLSRMFPIE
ncbi:MAG: STAS domain-containing protein [Actinomycetota bacterium]|nr:STAS domain-containing protein [Actinomycetota bacterium]